MDQHQARQRVHQAGIAQHDGPGQQAHLLRKEDAKRDDAVDPVIAAKAPERNRVTGDRTKQGGEDRRGNGDERGVQHVGADAGAGLRDAELGPGREVVAKGPLPRPADHRGLRRFPHCCAASSARRRSAARDTPPRSAKRRDRSACGSARRFDHAWAARRRWRYRHAAYGSSTARRISNISTAAAAPRPSRLRWNIRS